MTSSLGVQWRQSKVVVVSRPLATLAIIRRSMILAQWFSFSVWSTRKTITMLHFWTINVGSARIINRSSSDLRCHWNRLVSCEFTVVDVSAQCTKQWYFCKPILFKASLEFQRWSRRNLDLNSREIMAKPVFGRLKRNLYSKFDNAYVLTYLTLSRRTTSHVSVHSIAAFVL